ncbi:MAG: hypothetical protein ACLQGP_15130 [Isosphaeraceae bacterium]
MFLLFLAGIIGLQPVESAQQVEFLRLSYKANKDAFVFGTFRFKYTRGSSANLSDAESGVFSRAAKEEGFYVFDGKNARYDLIADPKELAAATTKIGEKNNLAFAWAYRMLTDGEVTLLDQFILDESATAIIHRPQISQGAKLFYRDGFFDFPLRIGDNNAHRHDLFHDLTAIKDGTYSLVELDLNSQLNGLNTCKLRYTYNKEVCTYWIDLSRGSVPLRITIHNNEFNTDVIYIFSDLEHVANAGWIPRKRLHILMNGKVVDQTVLTEIDAENKPPSSIFQLEFPESIRMVDQSKRLVYGEGKTWSLLKLPSASSRGTVAFAPSPSSFQPEEPGEIEAGVPWTMILPGAAILSLILGTIIVRRRHGRRPAQK